MKKGYIAEKERMDMLKAKGYKVFRVSGSIGACDLLVVKKINDGFSVWQEQVKNCKRRVFYFDKKAEEEWRRLYKDFVKFNIPAYFVVRFVLKRKITWIEIEVNMEKPPKKIRG